MLVLGDEPQECGLAVSMLERLHSHYQRLGEVAEGHYTTLVTNYRCHQEILTLSGNLFYETALLQPDASQYPSPPVHPHYPYPLCFVCSSIDKKVCKIDSNTNESEARLIVDAVQKVAKDWPTQVWGNILSKTCIMSPSRSQVNCMSPLFETYLIL